MNDRLPRGAHRAYAMQRLLYERFAVRLSEVLGDTMILKGGFMLELRLSQRRTTRDIDLGFWGDNATLLERLQEAGRLEKGDYLRFEVVRDVRGQAQGPVRVEEFKVTAYIGEDSYGAPFDLDIAPARRLEGFPPESLQGSDTLAFIGVERPTLQAYPLPLHLAEKLHAYAVPREDGRVSSRVRDLPDIALIGTLCTSTAAQLRQALQHCFTERGAALPPSLPLPPAAWRSNYDKQVSGFELEWSGLDAVHKAAATFIDPVLKGVEGAWDQALWTWC